MHKLVIQAEEEVLAQLRAMDGLIEAPPPFEGTLSEHPALFVPTLHGKVTLCREGVVPWSTTRRYRAGSIGALSCATLVPRQRQPSHWAPAPGHCSTRRPRRRPRP